MTAPDPHDVDRWERHEPPGEALPLVVRLAGEFGPELARGLAGLGALVVRPSAGQPASAADDPWPAPLAAAVNEMRHAFGRAYVLRITGGEPGWRLAAGLRGTPAHDADPWSVALLVGAARDAGVAVAVDPHARGAGLADELQGFDLARPDGAAADATLIGIVAALADGLRAAQSKC